MSFSPPTQAELLQGLADENSEQLLVSQMAEVTAFDRDTKRVSVGARNAVEGRHPEAPNLPVLWPGFIRWDIPVGTIGLVVVCDRDHSEFLRTGQRADPVDSGVHQLAYGVFIPLVFTDAQAAAKSLPSGVAILDHGSILAGSATAAQRVIRGDVFWSDLGTLLTNLSAWAAIVSAFCGTPDIITPSVDPMLVGDYLADELKVP